jgi:hypothetical protein
MRVKRASVAGFVIIGWMFLVTPSGAQINAAPPSVTSMGFGGHAINSASPSVTSLGPRGYTPGANPAFPNSRVIVGTRPNVPSSEPHHGHNGPYWGGAYVTPYYGYYDNGYTDQATNDADDDQYNGGPTIFDRRGPGYIVRPPAEDNADRQLEEAASVASIPDPSPAPPQPETVLVFKDGHQLEVENYAIVGPMLYDLTEGHSRKIGLSELDLVATAKQNDDRGIDFRVPAGSE